MRLWEEHFWDDKDKEQQIKARQRKQFQKYCVFIDKDWKTAGEGQRTIKDDVIAKSKDRTDTSANIWAFPQKRTAWSRKFKPSSQLGRNGIETGHRYPKK